MAVKGAAHVERTRRVADILYVIEDKWTDASSIYIGKTPLFTTGTGEPKWQIERQTFDGAQIKKEFANHAKWNNVWDNRTSYFGPPGGVDFPGDTITGEVTGTFRPSGLINGGRITNVTLSDAVWIQLPPTALTDRNAIRIQNRSGSKIYLQYDNLATIKDGMELDNGGENFYDITDAIPLYACADVNGAIVKVEELS